MTRDAEGRSTQSVVVPVELVNKLVQELAPDQGQSASIAFGLALELQGEIAVPPSISTLRADLNNYVTRCIRSTPEADMSLEEALISRAARALSAPAPSSLAGGEVWAALEPFAKVADTALCPSDEPDDNDFIRLDETIAITVADIRRAASVFAALSPEAPAREGVDTLRDALQEAADALSFIGRNEFKVQPDDTGPGGSGRKSWTRTMVETVSFAKRKGADAAYALTPRHEAPAEGAGERERLTDAYIAGAMSVHEYWTENPGEAPRGDPEFDETAGDYAYSILSDLRARSSAPEARGEALGNLLAVIHGDGGHRALEVGTKQAALEAEKIVAGLFAAPSADKLREFGQHTNLELSYHYSEEGDSDGWQVHRVNGGVNDREWDLIGSGATPADAIDQALAALKADGA